MDCGGPPPMHCGAEKDETFTGYRNGSCRNGCGPGAALMQHSQGLGGPVLGCGDDAPRGGADGRRWGLHTHL